MAAPNPEKSLQDEATCSICLDYFQNPMMVIDCGHNFCRDCIAQCCEGSIANVFSCPQCRKPFPWQNLRPNRHLWNIVELAMQFSMRRAKESGEQKLCKKHQEPLKLFCEYDQTSICVVCDRSKLHKYHNVIPIEEAAQVYQEKIHHCLQTLKEERDKILSFKLDAEKPSQDLLDIGSIFNRCKRGKFQFPTPPDSSELSTMVQEFSKESASLQGKLRKFRETLDEQKWINENVKLDPMTAHPRFIVFDGQKAVAWGSVRQELPYSTGRFDPTRCVLGCQGFTSGKHHWTVDVSKGTFWAVGVAKESVKRKGQLNMVPEEGIMAVGFNNGQYKTLTSPPTVLNPSKHPQKIQIRLDYEGGTVGFFDAEEKKRLVLFSVKFVSKIFPFFRVGDMNTVLRLC
ncbi:E3 ubiquitin-protein ligase TRIM58 isoform X2 [Zootoca vivipara]|uniref:E3 ubiquitin-protein ligase TRIM58 isoform X2 n=1 Tax=Zootoca vivipara TaxID=8524 RepID=UPI00159120D0|nr:E3 ubiquitin-protein ligase TRIM58-like isoform X2 [Zootoca vivipara]XP_060126837.1 E3 ubiquitin-protein ligase TRIM58 isoform X2 [Zootoca vivipara]